MDGTPTKNSVRSSWAFIPGKSPDVGGSNTVKILALEGEPDDKLSPYNWVESLTQ